MRSCLNCCIFSVCGKVQSYTYIDFLYFCVDVFKAVQIAVYFLNVGKSKVTLILIFYIFAQMFSNLSAVCDFLNVCLDVFKAVCCRKTKVTLVIFYIFAQMFSKGLSGLLYVGNFKVTFIEIFYIFARIFSKMSDVDLLYVGQAYLISFFMMRSFCCTVQAASWFGLFHLFYSL